MVCRSPVRVTVEEGSDDASRKHTLKNLVVLRGAPPRDDVVAAHDAFDSKPLIIPRTAAEADAIGVVAVLQCLLAHGLRLIGRIRQCRRTGGLGGQSPPQRWWRDGVLYQIYPRSFQDSNGDGIGDLPGIISRLDHLNDGTPSSLGVDGIWLSPFYRSPMKDFGYDVADYCDVDPIFGSLADFDRLLSEAHRRGIHVIVDLVPNHTSDQHPWFEAARSSRGDPKRDWYRWADPRPGGGPPNNWRSVFRRGGSAWTLDWRTGQYYLHHFLPEQPDLNWWNEAVREAMDGVLRFWLDRGVDGFRVDVAHGLVRPRDLRNNSPFQVRGWPRLRNGALGAVLEIHRRWR